MIALEHSTLFWSKLKLNSFSYDSPIFKFPFVEFGWLFFLVFVYFKKKNECDAMRVFWYYFHNSSLNA